MKNARARAPSLVALLTGSMVTLACGGAPTPAANRPAASAEKASAPAAAKPAIDLAPVPVPPSLAFLASVAKPTETFGFVAEMLRSVAPKLEALSAKDLVTVFLGDAIADVVDLSKRIDLSWAVKGRGAMGELVVSMAVLSYDDAVKNLAEDYTLTPRGNGVLALEPHDDGAKAQKPGVRKKKKPKKTDDDDDEQAANAKPACELWPAAGEAPYRLLCGLDPAVVEASGPYLTRTAARGGANTDLHVEVLPSLMKIALALANKNATKPSTSAEDFGRRLALDFFHELHSIGADGTLTRANVDLALTVGFASTEAPGTRLMGADPSRAKAPPAAFFQLPADALAAVYWQGTKPDELAPFREEIIRIVDDSAVEEKKDREVIRGLVELARKQTFKGGPLVVGSGFDDAALRAALTGATAKKPGKIPRSALHGWTLLEVDDPTAPWVDAFRKMIAFQQLRDREKAKKPSDGTTSDTELSNFVETKIVAADGLPAGAAHFESRSTPALVKGKPAPNAPAAHTSHVYMVEAKGPDGPQTWFALSEDAALAKAKLRVAVGGATTTRLEGRAGLEALRAEPTNWGGFLTEGALRAAALPDTPPTNAEALAELQASLGTAASAKAAGIPVLFTARATSVQGDGTSKSAAQLVVHARFPRPTVDSFVQAVGSSTTK